ncbi:MAG: ABC transporter permease [Caldilineaceae bacterium]|nr:ABC transporter permease [Caldilineaceae bacterium]
MNSTRRQILRSPPVLISGSIILVLVLVAIFADQLMPYDPYKMNPRSAYGMPSGDFLLGNDDFGRDVLSRLILGSRISLGVSLVSVTVALSVGVLLGLLAGYYGGWTDTIIMRAMDVILSFPTIVLAISVIAFLGNSLLNVIWVIALLNVPRFARLVYTSTLSTKQNQYVEAAQSIGTSDARILLRAILPNIMAPIFVQIALSLGAAIIVESGLSFLGLGVPPPEPSWGTMVATARKIMGRQPNMVIWPSLALAITVLSFNILGNGLRDVFDPRLRQR